MTATQTDKKSFLLIDDVLLRACVEGTTEGLSMTGIVPPPVGASRLFQATRPISVIVGLVGKNNGSMTLNLSERGMIYMVGKLVGEEPKELDESCFDAISEIGNMVAGRVKDLLAGTSYEMEHISVPSMVLGANYNVYYTRGMSTVSVEFELEDIPVMHHKDRFFSTSISLLQRLG
ncbi:MAG: chemotaxis protein CheX [Planctomycetes bacterium]|nr:chemotaxis protein CheX [Planctomycetota bacterium]